MKRIVTCCLVLSLCLLLSSSTTAEARSDLHGIWYYVQTPDTPPEMTYNPPRVEILPDNTATYYGYEAVWMGALSEAGENQYRFHITQEWGEGVYSDADEDWLFAYNPATGLLTASGNKFTQACYTVNIATGKLRVRERPHTNREVIGELENGAVVCPMQIVGDWAEFYYPLWVELQSRNRKAYVSMSFLKPSSGVPVPPARNSTK